MIFSLFIHPPVNMYSKFVFSIFSFIFPCNIVFTQAISNLTVSNEAMSKESMSSNVALRSATTSDVELLLAFAASTFHDTFAAYNKPEDMDAYMKEAFNQDNIMKQLQNPNSYFYLAELEGELVGYMKLNFSDAQSETMDQNAMEIERIYVKQSLKRLKIGQTLLQKALVEATAKQVPFVWLGVWEKNEPAIKFYEKQGFVTFDQHTFLLGSDPQTDLIMKKTL